MVLIITSAYSELFIYAGVIEPRPSGTGAQLRRRDTKQRSCNLYFVNKSCLILQKGILQRGKPLSQGFQSGRGGWGGRERGRKGNYWPHVIYG